MLNLEDAFESLERMREHENNVTEIYNKMKYWMSNEEIDKMEEIVKELKSDISDLEELCFKNDICPECGGDLKSKTWTDDDCGLDGFTYCEDCGKKWME